MGAHVTASGDPATDPTPRRTTSAVADRLLDALKARGWTTATAESCTGGRLADALTDRPGCSEAFLGGTIAYHNDAKTDVLGVPASLIERDGAVSESVARGLAEGACEAFGSDTGLGTTGVAGPNGGTDRNPVGSVWVAFASPEGTWALRHETNMDDRDANKTEFVRVAMDLALAHLPPH